MNDAITEPQASPDVIYQKQTKHFKIKTKTT
jgi:hypothetical protein